MTGEVSAVTDATFVQEVLDSELHRLRSPFVRGAEEDARQLVSKILASTAA